MHEPQNKALHYGATSRIHHVLPQTELQRPSWCRRWRSTQTDTHTWTSTHLPRPCSGRRQEGSFSWQSCWAKTVLMVFGHSDPHLSKKGHSEECAQQPFPRMHHLHHFGVGAVQSVVEVRQFLFQSHIAALTSLSLFWLFLHQGFKIHI